MTKIKAKALAEQDYWLQWCDPPVEVTWEHRVEFYLHDAQGKPLARHPYGYPLNPIAQGKMAHGMHVSVLRLFDRIAQREGYGVRAAIEDAMEQDERVLVDAFGPEEAAKRIGWAKAIVEKEVTSE